LTGRRDLLRGISLDILHVTRTAVTYIVYKMREIFWENISKWKNITEKMTNNILATTISINNNIWDRKHC